MVEAQHAGASPPTAQAKGSPREIFPGSVGDGVAAHTFGPAAVCKAVTRTSSYPDYEELNGEYHCRYPGCNRVFQLPGALHTHTGWHKRKENIDNGVYDRLGHHLKESHSVADAHGRVSVLEVYRCDYPGCGKLFQGRGALHTHQGWHKRRPKNDQASLMRPSKRSISSAVQTPRKRMKGGVGVGPAMGMMASMRPAVPGMMPHAPMGMVAPPVNMSGFFRQQVPAPQHSVPSHQPDTEAALALGMLARLAAGPNGKPDDPAPFGRPSATYHGHGGANFIHSFRGPVQNKSKGRI